MATTIRRVRPASGVSVLGRSILEAIKWGLVAHLIFNVWHWILPIPEWPYGYSVTGLVQFILTQIKPSWTPAILLLLGVAAVLLLGWKFMPLIQAAWHRKLHTFFTIVLVFGVTVGLMEVIYYGLTETLYFSWPLVLNLLPPLVVATIIIAGRGSRVYFTETGARDVDLVGQDQQQGDQDQHGDFRA